MLQVQISQKRTDCPALVSCHPDPSSCAWVAGVGLVMGQEDFLGRGKAKSLRRSVWVGMNVMSTVLKKEVDSVF